MLYLHKKELSDKHLPIQSQLKKHWKKVWIIFKLNIKTPERISTVFFGNFGHTSLHVLVFLLLTLNK